jgi:succinoglycan biosynthesis protein ExoM
MSELVLHLGTHKTGTTSIQHFMSSNREALKRQGILYPDSKPFFGGSSQAHHEFAHAVARDAIGGDRRIQRFVSTLRSAADHYDHIVLSSEALYRHVLGPSRQEPRSESDQFAGREAYMSRIAEILQGFKVRPFISFRQPENFAETLYATNIARGRDFGTFSNFLEARRASFSYAFQLSLLERLFGDATVQKFETAAQIGIVKSFFADANLGIPPEDAEPRLRSRMTNPASAWMLRANREMELDRTELNRRWHFALLPESKMLFNESDPSTFWPSNAERQAFFHRCTDGFSAVAFTPAPDLPKIVHCQWTDQRHVEAETSYADWIKRNQHYLKARERQRIPPYVIGGGPTVQSGPDKLQIAAICVITRNRPKMLAKLLQSLSFMNRSDFAKLFFVIVENSDHKKSETVVDGFRKSVAEQVHYELEPELGIPFARNSAVRSALKNGADLILFVDDDETVAPNWFEEMIAVRLKTGACLIGGPVALAPLEVGTSTRQKLVFNGIAERNRRKAKHAERLSSKKPDAVTIVTSNWLADASVFYEHNIWFDERLRFTGGSDTDFFKKLRKKKLPTGWASSALVYETMPPERLTFRYQFYRGKEQSKTSLLAKSGDYSRIEIAVSAMFGVLSRAVGLVLLIPTLPFTGGYGLVSIARNTGWVCGRLSGLCGRRSALYERPTGG